MSILTARPNTSVQAEKNKPPIRWVRSFSGHSTLIGNRIWNRRARCARAYTGVDFGETCTMPQRLSEPETCVYYQVAEFYHNMSLSVKTVSPAFFDLLEGYCLAVWRAYDQESEPYLEALASGVNDTGLSRSEVHQSSSTWETRRSPETLWKATAGAFRHTPSR